MIDRNARYTCTDGFSATNYMLAAWLLYIISNAELSRLHSCSGSTVEQEEGKEQILLKGRTKMERARAVEPAVSSCQ
jgi:hypothetical protein